MSKIRAGDTAPNFELNDTNGKRVSLHEALSHGPVVAAFFKVSCPTCQFTFPFLQRLFQSYGFDHAAFLGISQDDAEDTRDFCAEYGVGFTVLVDEEGYPASNEYGIANVPTIYLIAPNGRVQVDSVGFGKKALEKIAEELARVQGRSAAPLFKPGEVVPDAKPG